MNSASEALLTAMDLLVEQAISKLEFDKTIQAEVWSIVDLDIGEYKVRYSGNIFSAFAEEPTTTYQIGDMVYVHVPEGNFSGKKIITGKIKSTSLSYGQMITLTNSINPVSPNFNEFYGYDYQAEYGVVAGAPHTSPLSETIIYEDSGEGYHDLFLQYSKDYDLIRIKGSFLTRFHSEHNRGNYGLEIQFYTKSEDIVTYKLDINSFMGDPYSYSVYSPQSAIIKAQLGYLTGVKCIKLFEENFDYDHYVEAGLVTEKENRTVANIFVKDIEIAFVEQKDLTDNLYYLNIAAPRGNLFTSSVTTLDLVAQLIYQGENILDEKNCTVEWYERNLSVMPGDDLFQKNASYGWAPVKTAKFDALEIQAHEVDYFKQYKVVVIYKENVIMTEQTTVYNLIHNNYDFEIKQESEDDNVFLYIKNNKNDDELVGDWYYSYPDGSYYSLDLKKNKVNITRQLLYSSVVFYCGVYDYEQSKIVGTLEYTIASSDSQDDLIVNYDGEDTFRYDANGDVAFEDSEKERLLQAILTWKEGVSTRCKLEWISPDGQVISNERYKPSNSMIQELWVDNSNILHYNIKQKYNINLNNNTLTIRITTVEEKVYEFRKEILFLKDGDQGTNGTTYVIAVRPIDHSTGLKLSGLQPLMYMNGWVNSLPVRCFVYKDGELINQNRNYQLKYDWTGVNVTLMQEYGDDERSVVGQDQIITDNAPPYIKVQVTIDDLMNNRTYSVYCAYPIDVSVNLNHPQIDIIDISSIPSYVKYSTSGVNPQFYSNNIEVFYGEDNYTNKLSSLSKEILDLSIKEGLTYLKPATSFIFENNSIGLLKCDFLEDGYILHPIVFYLDNYGNEAINGWDGTSLQLNEEGGYILAPQIGAGEKDSFNRFTGVVMGKDIQQQKIGLYGYQSGINTFGLMEDGKAFFGSKMGGGQITIDGTTAVIQGGDGGNNSTGMTITLADLSKNNGVSRTTEAIKLGAGVFKVLYDGSLYASSADITGKITANEGYIGGREGWIIAPYRIYSSRSGSTHIELNCNKDETYAIWAGATDSASAASNRFAVSKTGDLYAKTGNLGGWTMDRNKFTSNNNQIGLASTGTYRFWSGADRDDNRGTPSFSGGSYFYVKNDGTMSCRNADISGKVTANSGSIGGWTINNGSISNGGMSLTSSGSITAGNGFSVTPSGSLTCNSANISGNIKANEMSIYRAYILNQAISGSKFGYVGMLPGGIATPDGDIPTQNLGFKSESGASIRMESDNNVAIKAERSIFLEPGKTGRSRVMISGAEFEMAVPAEKQHGIYARFA